jgi:hypothetical protein
MTRTNLRLALTAASLATFVAGTSGCLGTIRDTTTPRTSTEMLLVSTAAERAISEFDNVDKELKGKRVAIDDTRFKAQNDGDGAYCVSAARNYVSEHGAIIVPMAPVKTKDEKGKEVEVGPDRVLEIRDGGLGLADKSWGVGIPALPFPIYGTNLTSVTPPLYLFFKQKQEGWAKFQFWIYDPRQNSYVARSKDLWGETYYTKWWFFGIGPFDWSNDIYPDESILNAATK